MCCPQKIITMRSFPLPAPRRSKTFGINGSGNCWPIAVPANNQQEVCQALGKLAVRQRKRSPRVPAPMNRTGLVKEGARDWTPETKPLLRYIFDKPPPTQREADLVEAAAHANSTGAAGLSAAERNDHIGPQQASHRIGTDHREDEQGIPGLQ